MTAAAPVRHIPDILKIDLKPQPHPYAIKSMKGNRIGGYLVVWGDRNRKDLQGEYFTPSTELGLDWYPQRPILYHHGVNRKVAAEVIGMIDSLKVDEVGVWAEGELDMHNRWAREVRKLVDRGVISWSSGSLPQLVVVTRDGEIKRWPIVEGSLTPSPAEPRLTNVEMLKAVKGLDPAYLKELRAKGGGADATANRRDVSSRKDGGTIMPTDTQDKDKKNLDVDTDEEENTGAARADEDMGGDDAEAVAIVSDVVETAVSNSDVDLAPAEVAEVTESVVEELEDRLGVEAKSITMPMIKAAFKDPAFRARVKALIAKKAAKSNPAKASRTGNSGSRQRVVKNLAASLKADDEADDDDDEAGRSAKGVGGQSRAKAKTGAGKGLPSGQRTRWERAGLDAKDMAMLHTRMSILKPGWTPDEPSHFYGEMATKSLDAVKGGTLKLSDETEEGMERLYAMKANELQHTTNTGFGEEYIPELWLADLWNLPYMDNVVLPALGAIEMPSDPYRLPIEGRDPEVYFVPETTDADHMTHTTDNPIPSDHIGSDNQVITTGKLAIRLLLSEEQNEDSIIPMLPEMRRKALRAMAEAQDYVVLNADSNAVGNINLDGGTPNATDKYMYGSEGLLRIPIVSNPAQTLAAGGSPTLQLMRRTQHKLPVDYRHDLSRLLWIVDSLTHGQLINMPEFLTLDKAGDMATNRKGTIGFIDTIPVLVSKNIRPSAFNGKVSSTAGSNTRGRALIVHQDTYRVGYRRRVRVNGAYHMDSDAHYMIVTVRMGAVKLNSLGVALLYDIAV